jgi:predicted AAA+ superfamily ATPase
VKRHSGRFHACILQRGNRTIAIEVKPAASVTDADVRHLHWLWNLTGGRLTDRLIVTTGSVAYRRTDKIAVVPAALRGV